MTKREKELYKKYDDIIAFNEMQKDLEELKKYEDKNI